MKNKTEIIAELRELSDRMISCGAAMDYYGGFEPHIIARGREMVGAGLIARNWADSWEADKQ